MAMFIVKEVLDRIFSHDRSYRPFCSPVDVGAATRQAAGDDAA